MAKRKSFDYFDYFCTSADYICSAAQCLHDALTNYDRENFGSRITSMHEIENMADEAKHEMTAQLSREFIPPIDQEDIVALSDELDNVVDALDDIMRRIYMYDVHEIRPEALEISDLIVRCCRELKELVAEFRNFKSSKIIVPKIVMVNTLETDGDALHAKAMRNIFTSGISDRALFIWASLFDELEDCLDACEHASDVIEHVIMKNT